MDLYTTLYLAAFLVTLLVIVMAGVAFVGYHRWADVADQAADDYETQRARLTSSGTGTNVDSGCCGTNGRSGTR